MLFAASFFFIWEILEFSIEYLSFLLKPIPSNFAYRFHTYQHLSENIHFLLPFANFDGVHYLQIAHDGYRPAEHAFFPFYPLLIHYLAPIFAQSYFLAGLCIANISFLGGLYFLKKYLELLGKKPQVILWTFLFLLSFPTSFFFSTVYTEGLFFLLLTAALYFAQKKQYVKVFIAALLASLTKLIGIFLIIPLFMILLTDVSKLPLKQKKIKENIQILSHFFYTNKKTILISLSPVYGLTIYMAYLFYTTGDFLAFYHEQAGFHNGRTVSHLVFLPQVYYRYLKIFLTASHDITYFIAVIEFVFFTLFLIVLLYDFWRLWKNTEQPARLSLLGLTIFSLINLILPSLTGTLTSTPRYDLLSLSFFIRIAEIKNLWTRISLFTIFILFHVVLLSLFVQGHFVG